MKTSTIGLPCQAPPSCKAPSNLHARNFHSSSCARFVPRRHQLSALPPINADGYIDAGPKDPQPDYSSIDAQLLNRLIYTLFRNKMANALGGRDSEMEGYPAIIDLTRKLNSLGSPRDTQIATRVILNSLFPSWLPGAFKVGKIISRGRILRSFMYSLSFYLNAYLSNYAYNFNETISCLY